MFSNTSKKTSKDELQGHKTMKNIRHKKRAQEEPLSTTSNLINWSKFVKIRKKIINTNKQTWLEMEQISYSVLGNVSSLETFRKVHCREEPFRSFEKSGKEWLQ